MKTALMLEIEEQWGGTPIEDLLPVVINALGVGGAAREMEVPEGTFWYWRKKFGITTRKGDLDYLLRD